VRYERSRPANHAIYGATRAAYYAKCKRSPRGSSLKLLALTPGIERAEGGGDSKREPSLGTAADGSQGDESAVITEQQLAQVGNLAIASQEAVALVRRLW
jgi:hypothetical protein